MISATATEDDGDVTGMGHDGGDAEGGAALLGNMMYVVMMDVVAVFTT